MVRPERTDRDGRSDNKERRRGKAGKKVRMGSLRCGSGDRGRSREQGRTTHLHFRNDLGAASAVYKGDEPQTWVGVLVQRVQDLQDAVADQYGEERADEARQVERQSDAPVTAS